MLESFSLSMKIVVIKISDAWVLLNILDKVVDRSTICNPL
jgi:hypothetical protein